MQLGENTIQVFILMFITLLEEWGSDIVQSFIAAANLGASYVEVIGSSILYNALMLISI